MAAIDFDGEIGLVEYFIRCHDSRGVTREVEVLVLGSIGMGDGFFQHCRIETH